MKEHVQLKLTPAELKPSCKRLNQALAYLCAVVEEQGGAAELTVIISRPRKKRAASRNT